MKSKYNQIGVEVGLKHSYLGMTFDFSVEGQVKVTQEGYVSELVASEDLRTPVKTPALPDLFEVDAESPRLDKHRSEDFHSCTAKLLFLSTDICVAVSFLTFSQESRVFCVQIMTKKYANLTVFVSRF